jgi:hypothetical protein
MPTPSAVLLLATPLALFAILIAAFRATPIRSPEAAKFRRPPTPAWSGIAIFGAGALVYAAEAHSRANSFALAVVGVSLVGAMFVERKLLSIFADITRFYLDPSEWRTLESSGPRWRYEMQRVFARDPEYVDGLLLGLLRDSESYETFLSSLTGERFPRRYADVLDRRLWGAMSMTVRKLAMDVVPREVIANHGRYSSGKQGEEVFAELHELASHDADAFMDRWQYYWCLRNLNVIDVAMKRTLCWQAQVATVVAGGALYALGLALGSGHNADMSTLLGGLASGAMLWLLVVCGGASLLLIASFRGTGTFSVAQPCEGEEFDPLWTHVVQVGIVAFTVSFVVYGIGSPFIFNPQTLSHFHLETAFLLDACASFLFCGLIFACHVAGVHELMADSKRNALSRARDALDEAATTQDQGLLSGYYREVRQLRVWPIRGATVAQLAAGILLPVVVQAVLLYVGLKAK